MLTESRSWFIGCMTLALVFAAGWLLMTLSSVLTPFILAMALSYIFEPVIDRMAQQVRSRGLSVMILFVALAAIVLVTSASIVPALQTELVDLLAKVPKWCEWIVEVALPEIDARFGTELSQSGLPNIQEALVQSLPDSTHFVARFWQWLFASGSSVIFFVVQCGLILVVTYYCMRDWHTITAQYEQLVPRAYLGKSLAFLKQADGIFRIFIVGQFSIMLILGFIYTVALWVLSVPFAVMIGMLSGLLSIFPSLGSTVGMVLALLAVMSQKASMGYMLIVLALFVFGHVLESFYLSPKLVGDKLGLHPVLVMFALMAGGQLLGFIGVLIALPIMTILLTCMHIKLESTD